jgi:ribonuclease P protein component
VDLYVMPNALGHARLGLAVPRRVIPLASGRNRLKRLMRELFRLMQDGLPSLDMVARVKAVCPEDRFKVEFHQLLMTCRGSGSGEPSPKPKPT